MGQKCFLECFSNGTVACCIFLEWAKLLTLMVVFRIREYLAHLQSDYGLKS